MVPLVAVPSDFAGRVLVAKLGSAGIVAEVRGVSRVYPTLLDAPQVWVEAAELTEAQELISTDLEDELSPDPGPAVPFPRPGRVVRPLLIVALVTLVATVAIDVRSCSPTLSPPARAQRR